MCHQQSNSNALGYHLGITLICVLSKSDMNILGMTSRLRFLSVSRKKLTVGSVALEEIIQAVGNPFP